MAKHGEGAAWYGKTCIKCEAPINYAQAKAGLMPGYCGRCTDEVRRAVEAEVGRRRGGASGLFFRLSEDDAGAATRRVRAGFVLLLGAALGFGGAVALARLDPATFERIRGLLGS